MLNLRRIALAGSIALATALPVSAGDDGKLPIQALYDQVTAGDIEAAVDRLTEDAVYMIVPAPKPWGAPGLVGRDAIAKWWMGMHKDNGRIEVSDVEMEGDRAIFRALYYGDRLAKIEMSPAEFEGLTVLRDGKVRILVMSYSADYEPKLRAAMAKRAAN